jgi:hypothetical protein
MPYADMPGAYWGLFGPGYTPRRTEYDLAAAAGRIRASGWPQAEQIAVENILTVPPADEAIEFFERIAAAEER